MDIRNQKVRMTKSNVLLKFEEKEEGIEGVVSEKKSVIVLPNNHNRNRYVRAEVLSIGEEAEDQGVKVGDFVLIKLLSGIELMPMHKVCHIDIIEAVLDE